MLVVIVTHNHFSMDPRYHSILDVLGWANKVVHRTCITSYQSYCVSEAEAELNQKPVRYWIHHCRPSYFSLLSGLPGFLIFTEFYGLFTSCSIHFSFSSNFSTNKIHITTIMSIYIIHNVLNNSVPALVKYHWKCVEWWQVTSVPIIQCMFISKKVSLNGNLIRFKGNRHLIKYLT